MASKKDPNKTENPDAEIELDEADVKLGEGVVADKPATYTFYLKEVIPEGAIAHNGNGDMLDSNGGALAAGNGTPLTYGGYYALSDAEKAALSLPANIRWKKDMITYDTGTITVKVKVTLNKVTYRLEPEVTYTPDPQNTGEALFSNYRTTEKIALQVHKKLNGRSFEAGETFQFELIPENDSTPLRTEDGRQTKLTADAGKDTAAVFDSLVFTIEDLNGAGTKDFSYRIHEAVPDEAQARDAQGSILTDGSGEPLTYANATAEQKASAEIRWYYRGVSYAADQMVTIRVSLTTEGTLQVNIIRD